MPLRNALKTQEQQHIRRYSDAVLTRSIGVSWLKMARVLGYGHASTLGRKLNRYKEGDQYLPLHLSCLIESALWRLGRMHAYIAARRVQDGVEGISWDRLPEHLHPWD